MDPNFFNQLDGFSPSTQILYLFNAPIDPNSLIPSSRIGESVKKTSPIQLIEFGTKKRWPIMAEIDRSWGLWGNASRGGYRYLIIRPMRRLNPKSRYAVIITKRIKKAEPTELQPPKLFADLLNGKKPSNQWERKIAKLQEETIREAVSAGIKRDEILFAWDFRTGSDRPLISKMLKMREQVLKKLGASGPSFRIEKIKQFTKREDPYLYLAVEGKFKVPSYLDREPFGKFVYDPKTGLPKLQAEREYPFVLHIPRCVINKAPIPILIFGHGLFGGAKGEMESGYNRMLTEKLCMASLGTDWIGLSRIDAPFVGLQVLPDLSQLEIISSKLQQAHLNFIALIRLAKTGLRDSPKLRVNGKKILDNRKIYYLGISNGAIQGGTLMALTPDIERGVLNVGGANWSLMFPRSSNFAPLSRALHKYYKSPIERQLALALIQSYFDPVDPATYAPYLLSNPQMFSPLKKRILIQEGIGDAQVPNIATRFWARTLGIPGLKPLFEPVFGIPEVESPIDGSAYTQYGPRPKPFPPEGNIPATPNVTHGRVRRINSAISQMEEFFKTGKVVQFCKGVCDPN